MEPEILDEIKVENKRKTFSRWSLINSFIVLALFGYISTFVPRTMKANAGIIPPPILLIYLLQFFCAFGIILTGLSFIKKEPSNWYKWIGGILNILVFLTIVGAIVFAKIMDALR